MTAPVPAWLSSGQGGIPLMLLHGMGSTADIWLPQLHALSGRRQVVAWTAPGYGNSPPLAKLDWPALADALAAMLDALGIPRAHILGHSMGGMVAQEFHHRHPQRVQSLILSATSAAFGARDPQWTQDFIRQRIEPLDRYGSFAAAAPALLAGFMSPETPSGLRHLAELSASRIQRERYIDYLHLLTRFDRKAQAAGIRAPVLLLAGEHDTQAPPRGMQALAQRIPGARFHVIAGAAHMANLEAVDAFNQTLEDFLDQAPASVSPTSQQDTV